MDLTDYPALREHGVLCHLYTAPLSSTVGEPLFMVFCIKSCLDQFTLSWHYAFKTRCFAGKPGSAGMLRDNSALAPPLPASHRYHAYFYCWRSVYNQFSFAVPPRFFYIPQRTRMLARAAQRRERKTGIRGVLRIFGATIAWACGTG